MIMQGKIVKVSGPLIVAENMAEFEQYLEKKNGKVGSEEEQISDVYQKIEL